MPTAKVLKMTVKIIAGVDEVGRGPLAGPVVAAAVILPPQYDLPALADSKKLSEAKRDLLYTLIFEQAQAVAIGSASVEEIDQINILHASMLAMQRALENLSIQPTHTQIDGNRVPDFSANNQAYVGGDNYLPAIMAASIIAKVTRDRLMCEYDQQYPEFGFAKHKGYPTRQHLTALSEHGICAIHRKSFAPVKACIQLKSSNDNRDR